MSSIEHWVNVYESRDQTYYGILLHTIECTSIIEHWVDVYESSDQTYYRILLHAIESMNGEQHCTLGQCV